VVYGMVGLKTHCKTALVVRREGRGLRRYVHIGTGNYNARTARSYVDLGLLSSDPVLGADLTDLFNTLTGLARQDRFRKLLVAPVTLRGGLMELIEGEIQRQAEHGDGHITLKLNACVDPAIISALYRASQAGVPIELIVRGMCSLRPGIEGVSETIRVRSVIGRYLEHSRIFRFGEGERERYWIGSADAMERNLDRRIEAVVPIEAPPLQERLRFILATMLADDRRAWELGPDGRWRRVETLVDAPTGVDTFETLMNAARAAGELPEA
jgi:polyphosphate kinase